MKLRSLIVLSWLQTEMVIILVKNKFFGGSTPLVFGPLYVHTLIVQELKRLSLAGQNALSFQR